VPVRIWHQSITALDGLGAYRAALARRLPGLVRPGTEVVLHGLPAACYGERPPAEVLRDPGRREQLHALFLAEVCRAQDEGFDAVACMTFAEPHLAEARRRLSIPVVSTLESSLRAGCAQAARLGLVTLGPGSVARLGEKVAGHGRGERVAGIFPLEPAMDEVRLLNGFEEPGPVVAAFAAAARAAIAAGADAVIPAEGVLGEVLAAAGVRRVDAARVIDGAAVTLADAERLVRRHRA